MEEKGLSLLKRGRQGIARVIFSRSGLILGLLLVNAAITIGVFYWFEQFLPHVVGGNMLITVGMVLYLLSSNMNPTAKITWLILVMVLPVFGALLFWYTQSDVGHRAVKRRLAHLEEQTMGAIRRPEQVPKERRRDRCLHHRRPEHHRYPGGRGRCQIEEIRQGVREHIRSLEEGQFVRGKSCPQRLSF